MNRSSSFFWMADDALEEDVESKRGLSIGNAVEEGNECEVPVTDRSHLLIAQASYGMTGIRRRIFPARPSEESQENSIRFQVVVWHVGEVDVLHGHVPMKFRVSLFWNETESQKADVDRSGFQTYSWTMQGRQQACRQKMYTDYIEEVNVPPLSILNAVSFDIIGSPEFSVVREDTRLMRWTCMYSAVLLQENMRVDNFPHDYHDLVIKLAILANRNRGRKWDKNKWKLALATESDSQGSTRIPHGLLVDDVHIPDFNYRKEGLVFEFVPHTFGPTGVRNIDECLQVKLAVFRESGHYDQNIMPIMSLLNIVGITCIPRNFAPSTASTELMLSIAFVEIGFRLFIDSRLPSVGYQIKMQRILNQCFWLLMFLVLQSNICYYLVEFRGWKRQDTRWLDFYTAIVAFVFSVGIVYWYYADVYALSEKLKSESTKRNDCDEDESRKNLL